MKDRVHLDRWRWARAERRCRALEDALWAARPPAPEAIDVPTRFGPTRAYHWPGTGVPLVLLHGGAVTSVTWQHLAEALADRDVYAIDIMGDAGRSQQREPIDDATELAGWLDDALAGLGLDAVQLAGHSLGGWVAANAAIAVPRRLASVVLIDPGGIVPIQMVPFMRWGLPVMLSSFAPAPVRHWVARRKRHPLGEDKRHSRLMLLSVLYHRPGFPMLQRTFTDEELASITVPTTLVAGELTEMFDTKAMVERMRRLIPGVATTVVPGAGHALTVSHVDDCARHLHGAVR